MPKQIAEQEFARLPHRKRLEPERVFRVVTQPQLSFAEPFDSLASEPLVAWVATRMASPCA